MGEASGDARLALKVDIDTKVGLVDGMRRLADLLGRLNIKASFFVSMGPDHSGRALKRVFRPGFLRKQLNSGAASAYGPVTMMYGLLLPGPIIARQAPGLFNRCINEGHEVGLHGWDHVFWHDRMRYLSKPRLRLELGRAWRLFKEITGMAPAGFAAPGWQVTADGLEVLSEMGITHVSCTRGRTPFRPLGNNGPLPLIEIPTTMPSLDELLAHGAMNPSLAARELAELVRPGRLNVFTLHGEVEGRSLLGAFSEFCKVLQGRGVRFIRLIDAAKQALDGPVPDEPVVWADVDQRAYQVSAQASWAQKAGR